jgi:hypothetical protein
VLHAYTSILLLARSSSSSALLQFLLPPCKHICTAIAATTAAATVTAAAIAIATRHAVSVFTCSSGTAIAAVAAKRWCHMAVTTVTVTVAVTVTLAVTAAVTAAVTEAVRTSGSCVQFRSNLLRAFSCSALVPAYQSQCSVQQCILA